MFKKLIKDLALASILIAGSANAGVITIGNFSGGDEGEGLDFIGNFEYAVNVLGNGGGIVGDATFTNDSVSGVSISAQNAILNWHSANYGSSSNDNALEYIMQSIRWSVAGTDVVTLDLADLTVGGDYSLQLLFAESCCTRGFDIKAEGQQIVDNFAPYIEQGAINNGTIGAFVRYDFTAQDTTLNVALGGNAPWSDNNPILNGFTLERVAAVPEPSTLALFSIALLGLALRRRGK
ncbi:PEP-CTERM sorting domain-containing protein [Catenovulum sediminis]|uniref:PEP-CTERM sorting domain-containing protein n=1 Tax=Catenovulum sediminis TaxID=1740262 RepID=A0ABV1RNU5_9ALTE